MSDLLDAGREPLDVTSIAESRDGDGSGAAGGGDASSGGPSHSAVGLARAGLVVSAAFLLSRLLGYVRVVVIGTTFGAGPELDAFVAAFRIPDLIFQLVAAGAMSSALIPIVAGLLATGERRRAWGVVSAVATVMLAGLAALALVAFVAAPAIVPAITPGFTAVQLARTVELTRLMLVAPILLALGAVATSTLNAAGRFAAAAMAPVVYNLAIIGGALVLGPSLGVTALAVGTIVGSAGHLLVQLPPLRAIGFRYRPQLALRDELARRTFLLLAPRAVGLGATQIIFVVMTSLASGLGTGAISSFYFAFAVLQIPVGVIGVPLGVVVFPAMAREHALGGTAAYLGLLSRSLRLLLFVMLPIAAIGIVLSPEIVALLFGYGRFDSGAVDLTARTLACFLIGLAGHAIIAVAARAFYARQDTRTPVVAALITVVVDIGLAVLLVRSLGLPGVALAMAVGAWVEAVVLVVVLRRGTEGLVVGPILRTAVAALGGAALAALTAGAAIGLADPLLATLAGKLAVVGRLGVGAGAGVVVYVGTAWLVRSTELPALIGVARQVLRSRRGRHGPEIAG